MVIVSGSNLSKKEALEYYKLVLYILMCDLICDVISYSA